jgi:hypothetical protein
VLSDSDDFVMAELRATSTGESNLRLGPRTLHEMAMSLHGFATRETVKMAAYQLMLHSRDRPAGLADAQAKLAEVVSEVIVQAGTLPHHHQHFQWSDHKTTLHDVQNAFWARKSKLLPGATANIEPAVRKFALSSEACAESSRVAVGATAEIRQRQRSESQYPFRSINEAAITEAIGRLLDPTVLTPPLSEGGAVELTIRFMHLVDLLLQKWLFAAQQALRGAARETIETLIANPSAEAEDAEAGGLLGPLRMKVSTISAYDHSFDHIFAQKLSGPLTAWIQTVWENAAPLRDLVAWASEQGFTSLDAEAPAAKSKISNLVGAIQDLFPFEYSREVYEPTITDAIRTAASSEAVDMAALGWLFVRVSNLAYDRTLLDQLSIMEMNEDAEQVVLRRMSETIQAFVDQVSQFGHVFHNHKHQVDYYLAKCKDQIRALSRESVNTLKFVEKLAGASSEEGILGIPLAGHDGILLRFFKRNVRWFQHLHATEVPLSRFVAERGSLTDKAILHIDSGSSFTYSYTDLARVRYWLPLSIARSPVALNIQHVREGFFDLCIVDLDEADLDLFSLFYEAIEPVMRAGSTVILFARRMRGLGLRRDDPAFIRGMFAASGHARISYTDSAAARFAASIVESGRGICRDRNLPRPIVRIIEVVGLIIAAAPAFAAAWIEHRKWPPTTSVPANPISVTLEVSVP